MSIDLQVLLEFAAPHTGTSDALLLARSRSRWLLVVLVRGLLLERLVPELQRSCTRGLILEQVARVPPAPWADSGPSHPAPGQAGPRFCNASGAALLLLAAEVFWLTSNLRSLPWRWSSMNGSHKPKTSMHTVAVVFHHGSHKPKHPKFSALPQLQPRELRCHVRIPGSWREPESCSFMIIIIVILMMSKRIAHMRVSISCSAPTLLDACW